jgi:uncharacterized protein
MARSDPPADDVVPFGDAMGSVDRSARPATVLIDVRPVHDLFAIRIAGMDLATTPPAMPTRFAPAVPPPPYAYVPGHGWPHPVNDPAGHLYGSQHEPPIAPAVLADLPTDPASKRRALAAALAADSRWLHVLDLFNDGFYWEAHEGWEGFWNALGRTTPEARFVQGLIHLAAAAVKIREGKGAGVGRHAARARELLGGALVARSGAARDEHSAEPSDTLGLASDDLAAVVAELETYRPECWHSSRAPVVRVLAGELRPLAVLVRDGHAARRSRLSCDTPSE